MRVAVGSDHAGFALKGTVVAAIKALAHEVLDLGASSSDAVDYPDYAARVCEAILRGDAERGVLLCGSGIGVAVVANKFPGIRAGLCHDVYSAHQGVEHEDMNVLALGGRIIGAALAREIVTSFLNASFQAEERHLRRVAKITQIEERWLGAGARQPLGGAGRMDRIAKVRELGQSVWLDSISRDLVTSGTLRRLIEADGLLGMTSNPAIFEKAINGSPAYDQAITSLARQGLDAAGIYQELAVEDVRLAADLLAPVYARTQGLDGYVSLEVSPLLARDTEGTIREARQLFAAVDRPNIFIKVPATTEGLPAIRSLLAQGININVTLLFAVERYVEVAQTYLDGIEELLARGGDAGTVRSVASFFVSRIDTLADSWINQRLEGVTDAAQRGRLEALKGVLAIANAKIAYQRFMEIFGSERFAALRAQGAHAQRLLWGSTSTKNPAYADTLYVDTLIGPETVNTMPEETFRAFQEHGEPALTLEEGLEEARARLRDFEACGFSMPQLTQQLLDEGVAKFAEPFEKLLRAIEAKRLQAGPDLLAQETRSWVAMPGVQSEILQRTLSGMQQQGFQRRLWEKDASLWTTDPTHQERIRSRLGWLTVCRRQRRFLPELRAFADEIRAAGMRHVVLLGMGGSSLGPEVLRRTFGPQPGYPQLCLLDSTVPAQVASTAGKLDLAATLFVVSSKSGGTTESLSLCAYFYDQLRSRRGAGAHFVAITDPGSPLEELARQRRFRRVISGEPEVGGRFSVLSNFGMAPAALVGLDVETLLERAEGMMHRCGANVSCRDNPGIVLGTVLGMLQKAGRDKLTLVPSPGIAAFGAWLEQLIAESTGKMGTGLVPLGDEPVGPPEVYGQDRVFIYLRLSESPDAAQEAALEALREAGHPVLRVTVPERLDLGAAFYLWEIATATAGAFLKINAFDEPNVQESKDNTKALLREFEAKGRLPEQEPLLRVDGISLSTDAENHAELSRAITSRGQDAGALEAWLAAHVARLAEGDYLAINAYLEQRPAHHELLQEMRLRLRAAYRVATMLGYGPRFLHSTGQLHKGGPNTALVLQLTCDNVPDVAIPGERYSFGILKDAQALGDFHSLAARRRRALRLHLGSDVEGGLKRLLAAVEAVTGTAGSSAQG
ncbi:MAG: bifunctional transaldolase/phosoglucose isomerase [Candidatus Tectomicrobia bacterium]|nr:bifunctional transaldolase/phosoglucose isomerase [Candidatus Tectomicrobia bacterium]